MKTLLTVLFVLALSPVVGPREPLNPDRMRADVEFLAAPELEGRASLSRGADVAARFIATEMEKIGLQPVAAKDYLQPFDLVPVRLNRDESSIRVLSRNVERTFPLTAVFFPNPRKSIDLDLPVVFAGFGITAPELAYDDYAGVDVTGKAVLIFDHEPQEDDPRSKFNGTGFTLHANTWTKTRNAQQHGAAAVILVTEPLNHHRSAPRAAERANAPPQALAQGELLIPRVSVSAEVAETLFSETDRTPSEWQSDIDRDTRPSSRDLAGVRAKLHAVNAENVVRPSSNVVGLLAGVAPGLREETILVTSHYDHLGLQEGRLYPGANDNASGVAAMLEVARVLARQRLARSVLFVAFGSEEQLMLGSYYYVAHPLRPLDTTRAVLNLDMVGRNEEHTPESLGAYDLTASRSDQLNLVGTPYSPDLRRLLVREGRTVGMSLSTKFDRDSSMRALFRCDHLPFLQNGIPAVWLFGGFHPGYHEPVDTADRLDYEKMARVVRLTVSATRILAGKATPPHFSMRESSADGK